MELMASGRMLQKKISYNKDLPRLISLVNERMGVPHGAYAALLYTWCIAHLDVKGRMNGDAAVVKGQVVPRLGIVTPESIEHYLAAMGELGLVVYYEADGDRWLEFRGFEAAQPGLRHDREPESRVPAPADSRIIAGSLPAVSGKDPAEKKGKEEKGREEKRIEESLSFSVLGALNEARKRAIPGSRPLRDTEENLKHIRERLENGATVDECLHVIAVCESEVSTGGDPKWFDQVTPFRKDNFAKRLAMVPGAKKQLGILEPMPAQAETREVKL